MAGGGDPRLAAVSGSFWRECGLTVLCSGVLSPASCQLIPRPHSVASNATTAITQPSTSRDRHHTSHCTAVLCCCTAAVPRHQSALSVTRQSASYCRGGRPRLRRAGRAAGHPAQRPATQNRGCKTRLLPLRLSAVPQR